MALSLLSLTGTSSRTGKIARLPRAVRERLNERLAEGEAGSHLVRWLNDEPAVRAVLEKYFGGRPISEQNLSAWKQGGYAEWLLREDERDCAGRLEEAGAVLAETGGTRQLTGRLHSRLVIRLARQLEMLPFSPPAEEEQEAGAGKKRSSAAERHTRTLHGMVKLVTQMRRADAVTIHAELAQAKWERQCAREEAEAEGQPARPAPEAAAESKGETSQFEPANFAAETRAPVAGLTEAGGPADEPRPQGATHPAPAVSDRSYSAPLPFHPAVPQAPVAGLTEAGGPAGEPHPQGATHPAPAVSDRGYSAPLPFHTASARDAVAAAYGAGAPSPRVSLAASLAAA